jgi:hypothetical protein
MYLRLFFVYRGAVSAPLVPCPDPNRDPSAEFGAESAGNKKLPPIGAFPTAGAVFFRFFHPTLSMKPLIFCAASFFIPAVTWV